MLHGCSRAEADAWQHLQRGRAALLRELGLRVRATTCDYDPAHYSADASVPTAPLPLGRHQRSLSIEDCYNLHVLRSFFFQLPPSAPVGCRQRFTYMHRRWISSLEEVSPYVNISCRFTAAAQSCRRLVQFSHHLFKRRVYPTM